MALFDQPKQSRLEEYLNGLTHGAGFFLCLIASPYLMYQAYYAQTDYAVIACAVFCSSMLLMYGASTIYHLTNSPRRKMQMRSLDHICIFVLIAGSYTPFALLALPVDWGITFFIIAWSLAIIGIAFKIWFFERFDKISYLFYLAMGWLAIFGYTPLKQALGDGGMWLLIGGGAAYTIGILFFLLDQRVRFFHTLWHLFVIAGSAFHFLAVYKYVI